MTVNIQEALDAVAADTGLTAQERSDTTDVVARIESMLSKDGLATSATRRVALVAHSLSFVRRVRTNERLQLDSSLFTQVGERTMNAVREALTPFCSEIKRILHDDEAFLFATHVELIKADQLQ